MGRESVEQQNLFTWAEFEAKHTPELELMFHIPNGGYRKVREAARLKREGVKPGVPDICLPVPRGIYHGLFIEMKATGNYATQEQKEWLRRLNLQGYHAVCLHGFDEAYNCVSEYLRGNIQKLC